MCVSSDGDASSQQIVTSESLFIVFIHTDSYSFLSYCSSKKKAMKPNKLARVSFVKKKKTPWWNEKGQLHPCLLFLPVSAFIFIIICIWLVETALIALDMIRDKTVRSPKQDFLFLFLFFWVPFSYKTCSNHQTSILWPVHCVCIFYDFSIVALTGINHVMDERVLTDRRKRNNYARSRTVFIPFCISRARAPGPPLLF